MWLNLSAFLAQTHTHTHTQVREYTHFYKKTDTHALSLSLAHAHTDVQKLNTLLDEQGVVDNYKGEGKLFYNSVVVGYL